MRWRLSWLVVLAACGGSEPEPEPAGIETTSGQEDSTAEEPVEAMLIGCIGEGCGALVSSSDPPPPRPAPPPTVLPAARTLAAVPGAPRLQEAAAAYDALLQMSFEQPVAATLQDAVAGLTASIDAGGAHVRRVDAACARSEPPDPECLTLGADARDALADAMRRVEMPLPHDLRQQLANVTNPAVVAEVRQMVAQRIQEVLDQKAATLFCYAAQTYERAGTPRAQAQRAAYGEVFLGSCPEPSP